MGGPVGCWGSPHHSKTILEGFSYQGAMHLVSSGAYAGPHVVFAFLGEQNGAASALLHFAFSMGR